MIKRVRLVREIVVKAENKTGILADIAKLTAEHGINIEAMAGYVTPDNSAQLMVVTDDDRRTVDVLKNKGYESVYGNEVIVAEVKNSPGALKIIAELLAGSGIDVRYNYGTASSGAEFSSMIWGTSNNEKAVVLLKKFAEESEYRPGGLPPSA